MNARPYRAAFLSRFQLVLQYRAAALAGFATQCWWGGIKVMVLAAFYANGGTGMPLADAITYTWVAQGLLALIPWAGDPEVAHAVRTGSVVYDRLRPVDAYAFWFARAAGWIAARALPRLVLMATFAVVVLPLVGLDRWAWHPPADVMAGAAAALSVLLALALSAACVMLLNIATATMLNDRGINAMAVPLMIVFSGNLLPLALLPEGWQTALLLQPFAGLQDIPMRLYLGRFDAGQAAALLGLQLAWVGVFVAVGHRWMHGAMRRLDVQGG